MIEVFVGDCSLCEETVNVITVGKCKDCQMILHNVRKPVGETPGRMSDYNVTSVPTTVIDGRIKIVGTPDFPWFCSEEFYKLLEKKYPLTISLHEKRS